MHLAVTKKLKISFFMGMALLGFLAVFIGFGKTLPPAIRDVRTPSLIYIHGAFSFGWICLFFVQATLIRYNNFKLHKLFGLLGLVIAIGAALTMPLAGVFEAQKELKTEGISAYSNMTGTLTTAIMFLGIVIAGILNRKNPQAHKRLMLLATIVILWVAWFRFRHYFPSVPRPDIWFGLVLPDSLIIVSWLWDKYVNGKLHPVLGWVGAFIIIEQTFEVVMSKSAGWWLLGKETFELLTGWGIKFTL
jgi:hypothetical protein